MWLLRKITVVFFLLSLLLWTLVTFLLMCEPMANEYPQVSLRENKIMKGVALSKNKSLEGIKLCVCCVVCVCVVLCVLCCVCVCVCV